MSLGSGGRLALRSSTIAARLKDGVTCWGTKAWTCPGIMKMEVFRLLSSVKDSKELSAGNAV